MKLENAKTRFFKFPSMEASFQLAVGMNMVTTDDTGEPRFLPFTEDYAIDVVGVIYKPTGVKIVNNEGIEADEMSPLPGWHVNILPLVDREIPPIITQYEVFPLTPERDFCR